MPGYTTEAVACMVAANFGGAMARLIESDRGKQGGRYGHSSTKGFKGHDQAEVRSSVKSIHRVGIKNPDELFAQFAYTGGSAFRKDKQIHRNRTASDQKVDAVLLKRGSDDNGNRSYAFSHFETCSAEEVASEKKLPYFDCRSTENQESKSRSCRKKRQNECDKRIDVIVDSGDAATFPSIHQNLCEPNGKMLGKVCSGTDGLMAFNGRAHEKSLDCKSSLRVSEASSANKKKGSDNFNDEEERICRKDFSRSKKRKVAKVEVKKVSPYCVTPGQPQDVIGVPNYSGNGGLAADSCYGDTVCAQLGKVRNKRDPLIDNGKTGNTSPYLQASDGQERDSGGKWISNTGPPTAGAKIRVVSPYFKTEPKEGEVLVLGSSGRSKRKRKTFNIKFRFTKREKLREAYRRRSPENTWMPPRSDVHLLQEDHVHDPWRILVICLLLNKTSGSQVRLFIIIVSSEF